MKNNMKFSLGKEISKRGIALGMFKEIREFSKTASEPKEEKRRKNRLKRKK